MTRLVALPHLQTVAVAPQGWLVTVRGETAPAPDLLKGWDYATPLRFECNVSVEPDTVREECGLGDDAEFEVIALYWSSSTNRRGIGGRTPVGAAGQHALAFDVDPAVVGGRLTLHRQLVLTRPGKKPQPFAASEPGAVLWEEDRRDRTNVILEGDAARFPTELLDFRSGPVAEPDAAWWLQNDFTDPDASPLAALRLYVNTSHPQMSRLIAGEHDDSVQLLVSVLHWDVGRTMVHAALDSPAFVDAWGHFGPGSLGETVEQLLGRVWPSQDPRSLRSMRAQDRGLFDARLQGRLALLRPS